MTCSLVTIKRRPSFWAMSRALLASSGALAASSAIAAEPDIVRLEEVIVTAQKRMQTVQDVPSSIAALSEELLAKTHTSNFNDLGKIASGITISSQQDGFSNIIRIRGVGTNTFTPAIRPAVGIFVDEIPLVRTDAAFNNLADLQRIEILKGPQATLFGKEVSSGAISLFTKRPHPDGIEAYAETQVGNNGLLELRGGINLPLTETTAIRISAYDTSKSGDSKNIVDGKSPDIDADGFRARLLWEPSGELSAILSYEENKSSSKNTPAERLSNGDFSQAAATLSPDPFDGRTEVVGTQQRKTDSDLTALHIEWELSDEWSFNSVSGFQQWRQTIGGDQLHGSANGATSPAPALLFTNEPEEQSLTQEFRLLYDGDRLASVFGLFYADAKGLSGEAQVLLDSGRQVKVHCSRQCLLLKRVSVESYRGRWSGRLYYRWVNMVPH